MGSGVRKSLSNGATVKIRFQLEDDEAGKPLNAALKRYIEPHSWRVMQINPVADMAGRQITFTLAQVLTPKEQSRLIREAAHRGFAQNFPEDFLDFDMTVKPFENRVLKRRRR
jgi:hypothetical protein